MDTLSETRLRIKRQRNVQPGSAEACRDNGRPAGVLAPFDAAGAEGDTQPCVCPPAPPRRRPPRTAIAAEPAGDQPARRFSQPLEATRPWMHVIECDEQGHGARAIFVGNDRAYLSDISFDQESGRVRIEARLGQCLRPSELQQRAWLSLNARDSLSRVRWDPESGYLFLRAVTACQRLDTAADFAFKALARDVYETLEDDELQATLASSSQDGGFNKTTGGYSS